MLEDGLIRGGYLSMRILERYMRRRLMLLPLVLLLGTPIARGADDFSKVVDDYFAARFRDRPSEGTAAGLHQYDSFVEDLSRESVERRIADLKTSLARIKALDPATLSFNDSLDAKFLEGQIQGELLDLDVLKVWESNPMLYAGLAGGSIDGLMKRDFAPASTRLRSVIDREKAIPAMYQAARANLKNPPREFTDLAIRMNKGSIGFFKQSVTTWAKDAAGNDAALLREFETANAQAIQAVESFGKWLETELKPRSKGDYAIGAKHFADKLKYDELVETPLAEVLAKGEAQLAKDYNAFIATAKLIDPKKTPAEVMAALSDDHPTADDLIPSVLRSVEAARTYLVEKGIVTIPSDVRPRIEETPPYARSGSFASMDTPGPYETKATEAFYYVTPVEADWDAKHVEEHLRLYNPPVVAMINVHEAYPGHYLQFLYAPKFPTKVRKLLFCGTNAEGWAHYTSAAAIPRSASPSSKKHYCATADTSSASSSTRRGGRSSKERSFSLRKGSKNPRTDSRSRVAEHTTRRIFITRSASYRSKNSATNTSRRSLDQHSATSTTRS